jgi:hypothetical protein
MHIATCFRGGHLTAVTIHTGGYRWRIGGGRYSSRIDTCGLRIAVDPDSRDGEALMLRISHVCTQSKHDVPLSRRLLGISAYST